MKNIFNKSILILLSIYAFHCNFSLDGKTNNNISWDAFGYYAYLPITFLEDDLGTKDYGKLEELNKKYNFSETLYQFNTLDKGNHPIRYSCGIAIVSFPFFIGGHLCAKLFHYPTDGYSYPYQYWFNLSCLFWFIIGIISFNKLLKKYFTIDTVNILLVVVFIGTNFIHTTANSFGVTHLFEFTFYSLLLLQIIKYYNKPNLLNSLLLGLITGIITVIRPINIISVSLFIFWETNPFSIKQIKERLLFYKQHILSLLIIATGIILAVLPQLIYWKIVTGNSLYQGYDNPAEGLDILHPHTINFLFSFRKGWLLYTPIMLFSLIGLYYMFKAKNKNATTFTLFSVINIFLVSTWTCWWYASSYSQRTVVDTYPVLAISLGFFIEYIKTKNKNTTYIFITLALLLTSLNLFKMWQFEHGILNGDSETKEHFISSYFDTKLNHTKDKLLLVPRGLIDNTTLKNPNNYLPKKIYFNNFNDIDDYYKPESIVKDSNNNVYLIKPAMEFTPAMRFPFHEITEKTHAYIKLSFDCFFTKPYLQNKFSVVEHFEYKTRPYYYHSRELLTQQGFDTTSNKWNHYELYLQTPEVRTDEDNFTTYFWNFGHNNIKIDNLKIESYEPIYDPE